MKWKMKQIQMDIPGRNNVSKNTMTRNGFDKDREII